MLRFVVDSGESFPANASWHLRPGARCLPCRGIPDGPTQGCAYAPIRARRPCLLLGGWTLAGGFMCEGKRRGFGGGREPLRDIDSFAHPLHHTNELFGGFPLWLDEQLVGPALNIEPPGGVDLSGFHADQCQEALPGPPSGAPPVRCGPLGLAGEPDRRCPVHAGVLHRCLQFSAPGERLSGRPVAKPHGVRNEGPASCLSGKRQTKRDASPTAFGQTGASAISKPCLPRVAPDI